MGWLAGAGSGALLGGLGAALYLAMLTGSPGAAILAFLTPLPLFAAGLWLGAGVAAIAGLTGSAILLATGDLLAAALFAGLYAAPVVLLVRQALLARRGPSGALQWYPPGLLTGWLAGLGLAGLALALLCFGGPGGIETSLRHALAPVIDRFVDDGGAARELTAFLALVIPGAVVGSWMMMTVSNAILAQGVLARFGLAWRPSPDLAALILPNWVALLLAAAAGASVFGGSARFVGVNVMIVLALPICLEGLAVLHALARRLARPQIPLAIFYVLAGLLGWPLLVVAVLGLLDAPLGLRRRFGLSRSLGGKVDD